MRKAILMILGICVYSAQLVIAQGTQKPAPTAPGAVVKTFNEMYPNTKVKDWDWEKWQTNARTYEADFVKDGKKMEASFTEDGKWLKTKKEITKSELPAAVSSAISSSEYGTWTMSSFKEIEMPDNVKNYKVTVKKGMEAYDLKYDATGKLLKKDTDKSDKSKPKK